MRNFFSGPMALLKLKNNVECSCVASTQVLQYLPTPHLGRPACEGAFDGEIPRGDHKQMMICLTSAFFYCLLLGKVPRLSLAK